MLLFYIYIWVTPEKNKQKAFQREKEGKEGKSQTISTQLSLNHGIAETVLDKNMIWMISII